MLYGCFKPWAVMSILSFKLWYRESIPLRFRFHCMQPVKWSDASLTILINNKIWANDAVSCAWKLCNESSPLTAKTMISYQCICVFQLFCTALHSQLYQGSISSYCESAKQCCAVKIANTVSVICESSNCINLNPTHHLKLLCRCLFSCCIL